MNTLTKLTNFKVEAVSEEGSTGIYSISPLPPGFGTTLGNVLRRILLSSIQGAAITEVRITGVSHQFSTIEGIKEDVVNLILNLKQIRFKLHDENPVVVTLATKGIKSVTAKDFDQNPSAEVMNTDAPIAELTSAKATLELQVLVEPGFGYVQRESNEHPKIGVLPVDSAFSPIMHVADSVEPTRVGEDTNYDKLILRIVTDNSITPREALTQAAQLAVAYFAKISGQTVDLDNLNALVAPIERVEESAVALSKKEASIVVDDLDLPLRTINSLKKFGIHNLGDLVATPELELMNIRGLGETSIKQIINLVATESWK